MIGPWSVRHLNPKTSDIKQFPEQNYLARGIFLHRRLNLQNYFTIKILNLKFHPMHTFLTNINCSVKLFYTCIFSITNCRVNLQIVFIT